jgi:hypothetical protein
VCRLKGTFIIKELDEIAPFFINRNRWKMFMYISSQSESCSELGVKRVV